MRFHNLQILRLVAALGVVVFHLGCYAAIVFGAPGGPVPWLKVPWLASAFVPVFFALSGFVLTHALPAQTPTRYVLMRAARLYPGFWVALGLLAVVSAAGLWPGAALGLPDPEPNRRTLFLLPTGSRTPGQYPLLIEWSLIYEVVLSLALLVLWMLAGPRWLPAAVLAWLAVLAVKAAVRPGYGTGMLPVWRTVWVSAYVVPFLLGVLAYYLRGRGRRWRWPAAAAAVVLTAAAGGWVTLDTHPDAHLWLRGFASALIVWTLVQFPDAHPDHALVTAGGYSYGLYLVHVPVMVVAMGGLKAAGWYGTAAGVFAAGFAAITVGLLYGRFETRLYARIKKLLDRTEPGRAVRQWRVRTAAGEDHVAESSHDPSSPASETKSRGEVRI